MPIVAATTAKETGVFPPFCAISTITVTAA
jgi:hypothetical protein